MTFPGESIPAWDSGNNVGSAVIDWQSVVYRAGSITLTAGDESWVDVDLSPLLLTADDDAVVSWALEVASGSGALDLSETAGGLGSHTVSAGTLVVGSALTAADVLAGGIVRLTIGCTSGTVEVQQVKLRVWPPGGVVGGWSPTFQPDAVSIPFDARFSGVVYDTPGYLTGDSVEHVMTATQLQLRAEAGGTPIGDVPFVDFLGGDLLQAQYRALAEEFIGADPPARGSGTIRASVAYLQHQGPFTPDPPGIYGIDWVYPPNEVPNDPDGWDVIGSPEWGWLQGIATIVVSPDTDGPASGSFHVGAGHVSDVDSPSDTFEVICSGSDFAGIRADDISGFREFDLSTDPSTQVQADGYVRLTMWHDGLHDDVSIARHTVTPGVSIEDTTGDATAKVFGGYYDGDTLVPLKAAYTAGAYRYWTLTTTRTIPLRQYHRDDGQGVTPPRAFGGASRIRTGRAYGYD